MSSDDHWNMKKLQVWVPLETWEELNSLGYTSPTDAVTAGFKLLLETPANTPEYSQKLPALEATIQGLQALVEMQKETIEDLRKDKETLSIFAHYFKSLEYKRIESHGEQPGADQEERAREVKQEVQVYTESPARTSTGSAEKFLIRKACRFCGAEFETDNPRREYCKSSHRVAYNRKQQQRLKK